MTRFSILAVVLMLGYAAPAVSGEGTCGTTFAPEVSYTVTTCVGSSPHSVAIGDLDGINGPDLAVANSGNNVSVFLNNGDDTFADCIFNQTELGARSVAMGDLDGDLDLDLAVANYGLSFGGGTTVSVLLNNGDGTFTAMERAMCRGRWPWATWMGMATWTSPWPTRARTTSRCC